MNLDILVSNLSEKISNKKRLLNVETQVQSTQTANFDLNETIFDRIGSFLNVRDETSFTEAANEGRNLPFNNVPLESYANQEDIRVIPTETLEISIKTEKDRKSSEKGKKVSVRVDIGCRRIIKKKK